MVFLRLPSSSLVGQWRQTLVHAGVVASLVFVIGCGSKEGQQISGKVTFAGKPVPAGKIYFAPDSAKGNTGATGWAAIVNGDFNTNAEGGRGLSPGANVLTIEGIDPNAPKPSGPGSEDIQAGLLFAGYQMRVDISPEQKSLDIDVPESAAGVPKSIPEGASSKVVP